MITRFEVIQNLRPFNFTDFSESLQFDNNLFIADKIGP